MIEYKRNVTASGKKRVSSYKRNMQSKYMKKLREKESVCTHTEKKKDGIYNNVKNRNKNTCKNGTSILVLCRVS